MTHDEGRQMQMTKTSALDSFCAVDGHIVTFSFAAEPNPAMIDRMKQMLISSYTENHRFANSDEGAYNNGGETHVP